MKAAINGVLNISVLDGWWCEGFKEERGWKIGNGEEYTDHEYQDTVESQALYNVLTDEVIPCFFDRKNGDSPQKWILKMIESMKMAMKNFCSHVMVANYNNFFYIPSAKRLQALVSDDFSEAKALSNQRARLSLLWKNVKLETPIRKDSGPFRAGDSFSVTVEVILGTLKPEEIEIELYYGRMKSVDTIMEGKAKPMNVLEQTGDGRYIYGCDIICDTSGRFGFTARATPKGDDWIKSSPEFLTWV
jgi:starch phosphorylase